MRQRLLPFYSERAEKPDMIVMHSQAFEPEKAIETFEFFKVSSHYLIGEDGEIWQLVEEKDGAWHAGVSKWQGRDALNRYSIGIELVSPSLGQKPFTKAQQQALYDLLKELAGRYQILQGNIVGHSDIAPTRKADPGKAFFWKELAEAGIGLWYDKKDAVYLADRGVGELLEMIGYDVADVYAAAYAFCRRFLPEKIAEVEDVWALDRNPGRADEKLLENADFLLVLRAVAYRYLKESKTPCKI